MNLVVHGITHLETFVSHHNMLLSMTKLLNVSLLSFVRNLFTNLPATEKALNVEHRMLFNDLETLSYYDTFFPVSTNNSISFVIVSLEMQIAMLVT